MKWSRMLIAFLLVAVCWSLVVGAAVPSAINYQGRLTDGTNLLNRTVSMVLRVYDAASAGSLLVEDSNTVAVVDGLYATFIGDQVTAGSLDAAAASTNAWVEVIVDGTVLSPRERIVSVAYALNADKLDNMDSSAFATGTPLYAFTETDPVWNAQKAGYATGTPVYTETDPVWAAEKSSYATGTPLYAFTETDPVWATASNSIQSQISNLNTAKVSKSGDTMTGALIVQTNISLSYSADRLYGLRNMLTINGGDDVEIGNSANGYDGVAVGFQANGYGWGAAVGSSANGGGWGVAVGRAANGYNMGVAVGGSAQASDHGASLGEEANSFDHGSVVGAQARGNNYGVAVGWQAWGSDSGVAIGRNATGINGGSVLGYWASAYNYGAAVGYNAYGWDGGLALGYSANGANTNIAIGYQAIASGGRERIAVGHNVNNDIDNSARLRGTLYLDGGTGVYVRSTFGSGAWTDLRAGLATGTPLYAFSESDPVWAAEKSGYATGTPLYAFTESDPVWVAASNDIGTRISNNQSLISNLNTAKVSKTGDTMTGTLTVQTNVSFNYSANRGAGARNMLTIGGGEDVEIGNGANGYNHGVAMGYGSDGNSNGVAIGDAANGSDNGVAVGQDATGVHRGVAVGQDANASNEGVAVGARARGDNNSVGVGSYADAQLDSIAVGQYAAGSLGAIVLGAHASGVGGIALGNYAAAQGGDYRIAIGHNVTNAINDSAALRGTLYLDGGTSVYYRSTFGSGAWTDLRAGLATGTPLYAFSESDPVWTADKAGYATGTPLYAFTEMDPVWAAEKSGYATGTPLYAFTESDPVWVAASNDIGTRISNNESLISNLNTAKVSKTGDTMTGALTMNAGVDQAIVIGSSGTNIAIGNTANGNNNGTAVGQEANGNDSGAAVGGYASASGSGAVLGYSAVGSDHGAVVGYDANAFTYGAALGDVSYGYQYGAAVGASTRAHYYGAAIGYQANGQRGGVAIGAGSRGTYSNIAIGAQANADGGTNRIAIGVAVAPEFDNSITVRGDLYLDGGRTVYYRQNFGMGAFSDILTGYVQEFELTALSNNVYSAGFATNYVRRTGDTMTGALSINSPRGLAISSASNEVEIGNSANATNNGTAMGYLANGSSQGAALGYQANGNFQGAAVGRSANASLAGAALGYQAVATNFGAAVGNSANGNYYGSVLGYTANGNSFGAALGYQANGNDNGIAVGRSVNGATHGVAIGRQANGAQTNVAIGYAADSGGGTERVAIGHNVTNTINDSAAIRGTLYLDGGTGVYYRSTFGSGAWESLTSAQNLNGATSFVRKTGDTMTGTLTINSGVNNILAITNAGSVVQIGNAAIAGNNGVAVGYQANGATQGAALGYQPDANNQGAGMGYQAIAWNSGAAVGYQANGANSGAAVGHSANGYNSGVAIGGSSLAQNTGVGVGQQANGANTGAAVGQQAYGQGNGAALGASSRAQNYGAAAGFQANGFNGGAAIGYQANGNATNIAIGYQANAAGGSERIAIGHSVVNTNNNSAVIRGTLYLDGASNIHYRSTFGSGGWSQMAGPQTIYASQSQSLNAGDAIAISGRTYAKISGNGSAVDLSSDPQIADGVDGQIIILQGTSDANTVKLDDGTGLQLAGGVSFTLGANDTMQLIYDGTDWIEVSRSDN